MNGNTGGGVGLVVGLFAPQLLAATAIGTSIGALLGHLAKKHKEKALGVELDECFPPNSSAVVVVIDDKYLDRVEAALVNSDKRINKAISQDDYDKLCKDRRQIPGRGRQGRRVLDQSSTTFWENPLRTGNPVSLVSSDG